MDSKDFRNLPADAVDGIQRGHGFLENHADFSASHFADLGLACSD